HTQNGNNNTYCQDNELTWLDWELTPEKEDLLRFVRRVIAIYHEHPVFRRRRFFHGRAIQGEQAPEIAWVNPQGKKMSDQEWQTDYVRCLGMQLVGGLVDVDDRGGQII